MAARLNTGVARRRFPAGAGAGQSCQADDIRTQGRPLGGAFFGRGVSRLAKTALGWLASPWPQSGDWRLCAQGENSPCAGRYCAVLCNQPEISLSRMSHPLFPLHLSHLSTASATAIASGFKENVLVKCKALTIALACRIATNSALATPLLIYDLKSLSSSSTCLLGTCRGHHLQ